MCISDEVIPDRSAHRNRFWSLSVIFDHYLWGKSILVCWIIGVDMIGCVLLRMVAIHRVTVTHLDNPPGISNQDPTGLPATLPVLARDLQPVIFDHSHQLCESQFHTIRHENESLRYFLKMCKNEQKCLKTSWKSTEWGKKFPEIRKFHENSQACNMDRSLPEAILKQRWTIWEFCLEHCIITPYSK